MENEKMKVGIGKETPQLTAKMVRIVSSSIEIQHDKQGKVVGDKVKLMCKHPDRNELIEISKVDYMKNKKIKTSGLWFKQDESGAIPFNTALAHLLIFLGAGNLSELDGKNMQTITDEEGYLTAKAY